MTYLYLSPAQPTRGSPVIFLLLPEGRGEDEHGGRAGHLLPACSLLEASRSASATPASSYPPPRGSILSPRPLDPLSLSDLSLPEAPVAVDLSSPGPPRPCRQPHKIRRELLFLFPLFPRLSPSFNHVSRRSPKDLVAGHVIAVVVVLSSRGRAQE